MDDHECFFPSGKSAGRYFSGAVGDLTEELVPAGSTCSSIRVTAALSVRQLMGQSMELLFVKYSGASELGTGGAQTLSSICEFNPGGALMGGVGTCAGNLTVSIAADDQIALCFKAKIGVPEPTKAAWNLRCLTP